MEFDWDPAKAKTNLAKHGVPFAVARRFEFQSAKILVDDREDYGEERLVATGFIGDRLHVLVYAERGNLCWVISLRQADRKEADAYVEHIERGW